MKLFARRVSVLLIVLLGFLSGNASFAQDGKPFTARATGQVVSGGTCGLYFCQTANVAGVATRLGPFTGELRETVDLTTGLYTGEATFNFAGGGTITTTYTGQILGQVNGLTAFLEHQTIVSSTGRLSGTTGTLEVLGTSDGNGVLAISGAGQIVR